MFHYVVCQDNKSAILLDCYCKASSSKRTKHISIRYFFVKDRIDSNKIQVKWYPTKIMIADYMTKPLQGAIFKKFLDQIMEIIKTDTVPKLDNKSAGSNNLAYKQIHHRSVLWEVLVVVIRIVQKYVPCCSHKLPFLPHSFQNNHPDNN